MLVIIVVLFLIIGVYFFKLYDNSKKAQDVHSANTLTNGITKMSNSFKKTVKKIIQPVVSSASEFATYKETPVNFKAQVPAYKLSPGLNNVVNYQDFNLSKEDESLLVKNYFVVHKSFYDEFFSLYEQNRYNYIPNFITTDSILHNYHLMFNHLLRTVEEDKLIPELKKLNALMLAESLKQYQSLKGTVWETSAQRNVGFFAVGSKLLDNNVIIPNIVKSEVEKDLNLIAAHQGVMESAVMNLGAKEDQQILSTDQGDLPVGPLLEDYSQYVPRGHYNKSEALKSYFKSMMWYGRLGFRMKSKTEIKSAILITLILNQEKIGDSWDKIYEPINFFVGKSDDINYYQFRDLVTQIYGSELSLKTVVNSPEKLVNFISGVSTLDAPQINSMPIFGSAIQKNRDTEIKAFRFFGQRFTIDASIFQRLIYREVGDKKTNCSNYNPQKTDCRSGARCLPRGLDIVSALGSKDAYSILKGEGETDYACYDENLNKMQSYITNLSPNTWTQNLYWAWLYQLLPLTGSEYNAYPSFMNNSAWVKKEINTFLGSWTELKHDTILYAKQAYAELGGAGGPKKKDDRGYVEPQPSLYARLASLVEMTSEGLEIRSLLSPAMKKNLEKMKSLSLSLKTISEKELNNQDLTDEEYELIRSYGGQLEHFWLEVNKNEAEFKISGRENYLNENPAAIVADVATNPNGQVLEEATGNIFTIYVVVPVAGKLRIAKGGVYSYYEFTQPMKNRLTDKKWRELLRSVKAPALPKWTNEFITQ